MYGAGVVTVEDEDGVFSSNVAVVSARFRARGTVLTRVVLDAAAEVAPKDAGVVYLVEERPESAKGRVAFP